jgi:hypothetical protein
VTLADWRLQHELALLLDELFQLAEKRHMPPGTREAFGGRRVAPRRDMTIVGYRPIHGTPHPVPIIDFTFPTP